MRDSGILGSVKQTPSQLQHNNFVLVRLAEEQ